MVEPAKVNVLGIFADYAGKHEPVPELVLVSTRQAQSKIFFDAIEESTGPWGFQVLVDGNPSTLNPEGGTYANPQDVSGQSKQAFFFYLPKEARRTKGRHQVVIITGHFDNEKFVGTKFSPFTVIVEQPEYE